MAEDGAELWLKQTIPEKGAVMVAGRDRLVSTYRPMEMMFAATGKEPNDLRNKEILNIGAGRTHWGFELTKKYGVVAKQFENFDIAYAEQPLARRLVGKIFAAESVGNIKKRLPYRDESFDIVWCSFAPANWNEFIRVTKPGGEVFVLGGDYSEEMAQNLSEQLHLPVTCEEISEEKVDRWKKEASEDHQATITLLVGKKIMVARKP